MIWHSKESESYDDPKGAVASIDLAKEGNGYAVALPIQIPTGSVGSNPLRTMSRITVRSESNKSKNGVRRLLLAVNMPYFSLDAAAYGTGTRQISPARSGKTMTAHVVITLPKEVEEDMRGMYTGESGVTVARSQLAGLIELLRCLVGNSGNALGRNNLPIVFSGATEAVDPDTGKYQFTGPVQLSVSGQGTGLVASTEITGYESQVGLIMPNDRTGTTDSENPLLRAIMGLEPFAPDGAIGVNIAGYESTVTPEE